MGGTTAAARNVISGNTSFGIYVYDPTATGHLIEGNYIGTNPAGTAALGNGVAGIVIYGNGNTVGVSGAGNVISGNGGNGVTVVAAADGNVFRGNLVGTNAAGTAAVPNAVVGLVWAAVTTPSAAPRPGPATSSPGTWSRSGEENALEQRLRFLRGIADRFDAVCRLEHRQAPHVVDGLVRGLDVLDVAFVGLLVDDGALGSIPDALDLFDGLVA